MSKLKDNRYIYNRTYQSIAEVIRQIKKDRPVSILYIGVELELYGSLLRDAFESTSNKYQKNSWKTQIDSINVSTVHQPLDEIPLYDQIFVGNLLEIVDRISRYDSIILDNHIQNYYIRSTSTRLISRLLEHVNKSLIVTTPVISEHEIVNSSKTREISRKRWTIPDFADFNFRFKRKGNAKTGTYIYIFKPNAKPYSFSLDNIKNTCELKKDSLTIGYVIHHKELTGGLKILFAQMEALRRRGNKVYAIYVGEDNENKVFPHWIDIEVDKEIMASEPRTIIEHADDCDIFVLAWIDKLPTLTGIATLYLEQGHPYVFGDVVDDCHVLEIEKYYNSCYLIPHAMVSVSGIVSRIIKARYGRDTKVINNGVDTEFYFPGLKNNDNSILLVGNPSLKFKGFEEALECLQKVWNAGYKFKVRWICQVYPDLLNYDFDVDYILKPTQLELAEYYRKADLFLFTSWYEGFGMPPLEAMASGVPVVCTRCGGVDVYVEEEKNALTAEVGDITKLANNIMYLLDNEDIRIEMGEYGRETALKFSLAQSIHNFEDYLYQLVDAQKA